MNEAWLTETIHDLRRTPGAYWTLAAVLAVALYTLGDVTPVRYEAFGNGYGEFALFERLGGLGIVLTAAAPVLALRAPVPAALAAAGLPLGLALLAGNHTWPLTAYLGLVAVAVCAQWAAPRKALGIAVLAALLPVTLQFGGSMLVPGGAEIDLAYTGFVDNCVTYGAYAVMTALAFGAGRFFRVRVERGRAGVQALARAGEVEERAAVLAERSRLARDLHDVVAHHVSLIAVRAETAPYTHPDLDDDARGVLTDIAADARLALDELRGVLGILGRAGDEPDRSPQPSWADIGALVERSKASGTVVILEGDDPEDSRHPVPPAVGYAAYRVVQEALTNARKHAPGRPVTLRLTHTGQVIVVRVSTPLRGETPAAGSGHGIAGMRERVEALGGMLRSGAEDDAFVVEATLPGAAA